MRSPLSSRETRCYMNPSRMGHFGRESTQRHGCVHTGSQITISPGHTVREGAQIQLMSFGQGSQWEGKQNGLLVESFGQMECTTVPVSTAKCVMELMCYPPALLCPISASGESFRDCHM